ncbi:YHS domain-containing (seleno)protein [Terricaulis sp.]|uniref:YHS domain-containing (seleno)protein n=1 Tax=Terricaulis sp. TaxID=2768686 RepID=UPI0037849797
MRKLLTALGFAIAAFVSAPAAFADQAPVHTGILSNVAVGGYDPVAYFTDGRPVRGNAQFSTTYQNYEYRFASAEHLAAFRANPARYLPQYGGYCAWAVAQGYTAPGNPNNWRVVDGKLYLNYDDTVQRRWEANIPGFIASANRNWPAVLSR